MNRLNLPKVKARIKRIFTTVTDPVHIGKFASTHGRPCSCNVCKRPRYKRERKEVEC